MFSPIGTGELRVFGSATVSGSQERFARPSAPSREGRRLPRPCWLEAVLFDQARREPIQNRFRRDKVPGDSDGGGRVLVGAIL